jgi:hypothetical protein
VSEQESQPYDRALKSLFGDEAAEIIPNLVPESELLVCMYSLLPAMKGANAHLLLQVIEEMKQHYQGPKLGDHLARFQKILRRSSTMPELDKQIVEEALNTYDSLMDDSPVAIRNRAKGELHGAQKIVTGVIGARFPTLAELAKQRVTLIRSTEALDILAKQVVAAPDEATARWVLNTFAA